MGKNVLVSQIIFSQKKDHFQLTWKWSFSINQEKFKIGKELFQIILVLYFLSDSSFLR